MALFMLMPALSARFWAQCAHTLDRSACRYTAHVSPSLAVYAMLAARFPALCRRVDPGPGDQAARRTQAPA
jgi:hypothetical protein